MLRKIAVFFEMIKFQHTLFALPFAILSACYAAKGLPTVTQSAWLLVAMVSARSAAMAFNRIADATFDALNPRTQQRALPQKQILLRESGIFTVCMATLFVFSTYQLNEPCFLLSPVVLLIILGYSYTKRFTSLTHFVLGFCLALAPFGAWLGITGRIELFPVLLGAAVLFWTSGFDIIYACQDIEFDRRLGLRSIPASLGVKGGLIISTLLHFIALVFFFLLIPFCHLGLFYKIGCLLVGALLIYEHLLVRPADLRKVNAAFFTVNAIVSFVLMTAGLLDLFT